MVNFLAERYILWTWKPTTVTYSTGILQLFNKDDQQRIRHSEVYKAPLKAIKAGPRVHSLLRPDRAAFRRIAYC